jgi:hypothetical protein
MFSQTLGKINIIQPIQTTIVSNFIVLKKKYALKKWESQSSMVIPLATGSVIPNKYQ